MIDLLQSAWAFLTSGTITAWLITLITAAILFILWYYRSFFLSLTFYGLALIGLYFVAVTVDFTPVIKVATVAKNAISDVIEEGKKDK